MITVGELFELAAAAKEGKKIEMEAERWHHGYYESHTRNTICEVDFLSLSLEDLFDTDDRDDAGFGDTCHVRFKIKDDTKESTND